MNNSYVCEIDQRMHVDRNFDTVRKELRYGSRLSALVYYYAGLTNGELLSKLMRYMICDAHGADLLAAGDVKGFLEGIPLAECTLETCVNDALVSVCSGCALFLIDGVDGCLLLDVKKYPARSIEEPQKDKVLRGSRDGFAETLMPNGALIRRRIRDPRLVFQRMKVGSSTSTDLLVCYMEGIADRQYVGKITAEIGKIKTMGLNLGLETLTELMIGRTVYNPFPKVRYTERPDAAAAMLLEGKIIVICDNYPAAMILPTSLFDFLQDTDDFYFSPVIGGYMKFVRNAVYMASLLLTPLWYTLQQIPWILPESLDFLIYKGGDSFLPLILQLLLVEISIDGLKLASLNTPDTLSNSLSVISGLILGDLAVSVGWLSEQVILYMAFVAIANFTQPSFELGYAFKFMRIITISLIAVLSFYGLAVGFFVVLLFILSNRTLFSGKGYLYPLIPFDRRALRKLFFRSKASGEPIC